MKKILLKILLCVTVSALILLAVFSAFLRRYDSTTGLVFDGFGRTLIESPAYFRSAGLPEHWAGFGWSFVDSAAYLLLFGVAAILRDAIWPKK